MVSALDADGTLAALWSPGFEEMALLNSKPANAKLGVAVQLMFYRASGRFSLAASEFPDAAIAFLADQIGAPIADITAYDGMVALDAAIGPKSWRILG